MKKLYGGVALLMTGIAIVSLGITAFTGTFRQNTNGNFSIVASFYPMYTAALNLAEGVEGVRVTCLAQPQTGCLHDYQLSPDNMITLKAADLLVLNGAGAESFLDQVLDQLPDLRIADTSKGIPLLDTGHDHRHEEGEAYGETGEQFVTNEHIWMSPALYAKQVENLRDQLCDADPDRSQSYQANAEAYLNKIQGLVDRLETVAQALNFEDCVTFHDSLAYLAADLQLPVAGSVSMGEESTVSASELGEIADAIRGRRVLLLYDNQYPVSYTYLGQYAAKSYTAVLDAAVIPAEGVEDKDRWLQAMEQNLSVLEAAIADSENGNHSA